jgi:hypothetical protein
MKSWRHAIRDGFVSGAIAAAVTGGMLAASGQRWSRAPLAPVNAISHWLWGDEAARHDSASLRYSVLGYVIHHGASTLWASLYERYFGQRAEQGAVAPAVGGGLAVSAVACFTDYYLTPHRLQPGYEMRLPKRSLAAMYIVFGLGLAVRGLAAGRRAR